MKNIIMTVGELAVSDEAADKLFQAMRAAGPATIRAYYDRKENIRINLFHFVRIEDIPDDDKKPCTHDNTEIRSSVTKTGVTQYRQYCPDCKWLGRLIKKEEVSDPDNVKPIE